MRGVEAPCPACGGPVEFKISSALVTVCEFCRSVVARKDRKLEVYGKVAAIVETASPLQVGLRGKYKGKRFELVGRVQFRHSAGGRWDEWYAAFPGGRWGWLAESQGRLHLTFSKKLSAETKLPELHDLEAGKSYKFPDAGELKVAEIGTARSEGAEGELPFSLRPGTELRFADLSGAGGAFATFDYSDETPAVYVGEEVTLDDLGLADAVAARRGPKRISATQVNCPQCGGVLELLVPDETQRVCCPHCSSLLDADHGKLEYLQTLDQGRSRPLIAIGTVGTLEGTEYTVIGFMRRSVTYDRDYYWSEYLLYRTGGGFRWLVHSDFHWNLVEPMSPGDVDDGINFVNYDARKFKLFQQAVATVRYVLGEFYWKVKVNERAYARDFICPPHMITIERSLPVQAEVGSADEATPGDDSDDAEAEAVGEINCSLATYLPHEKIEAAFGMEGLHKGWKPAPNQPSPVRNDVFKLWGLFALVLIVLDLIFVSGVISPKVDQGMFLLAVIFVSLVPIGALIYKFSFETSRWKDSEFNPYQSE